MTDDKLIAIRAAFADYWNSEGCDCCEGDDHAIHEKRLAELLGVEHLGVVDNYDMGYNWAKYTKEATDESK